MPRRPLIPRYPLPATRLATSTEHYNSSTNASKSTSYIKETMLLFDTDLSLEDIIRYGAKGIVFMRLVSYLIVKLIGLSDLVAEYQTKAQDVGDLAASFAMVIFIAIVTSHALLLRLSMFWWMADCNTTTCSYPRFRRTVDLMWRWIRLFVMNASSFIRLQCSTLVNWVATRRRNVGQRSETVYDESMISIHFLPNAPDTVTMERRVEMAADNSIFIGRGHKSE